MLSLAYEKLGTIQLFPHRQAVAIRPKGIDVAKVPEPSRQVGAAKETTNALFANSDRPVSSRILVARESIHGHRDNNTIVAVSNVSSTSLE
jgi:hypothetical protein